MLRGMKVWLKLIIGAAFGVLLGLVLPAEASSALEFFFTLAIRIGKYALIPLVLFSVPIAINNLRLEKRLGRVLMLSAIVIAAGLLAFSAIGVVSVSVVDLPKVESSVVEGKDSSLASSQAKDLATQALEAVPANPLSALASGADFLFPVFLFAVVLGFAFGYDRSATKHVVHFFDSMSRIMFHVNSFIVEFLAVFVIAMTAHDTARFQQIFANSSYWIMIIVVLVESIFVIFVALPAFLYFATGRKNPFPVLYGLIGPALAGLFSGDVLFSCGTLLKHSKDNLGVRRRSNSVVVPLFLTFGRAGTMLVAATTFVIVQISYTALGFDAQSFFWLLFITAPLIAIGLGPVPGSGVIVAVTALCNAYGQGFQQSAIIAIPVAFPLAMVGAFLDMIWTGAASYAIAHWTDHAEIKQIRHFV
jgi:Na+/H+-dicarboxylate symporter